MGDRQQQPTRTATSPPVPPAVESGKKARIGFIKSANAQFLELSEKERLGLLEKLKELAFNPALGKPLVRELKGCVRITYGRIRCVARCAEGVAVVLVLVVARRSAGSRVDVYELAAKVFADGDAEIREAFQGHITAYLTELKITSHAPKPKPKKR